MGAFKKCVYKDNLQTIEELKTSIETNIKNITPNTLSRVFENMKKRAEACVEMNEQHFEHML